MKALTAIDRAIKLIEAESGVPATDLREARAAASMLLETADAVEREVRPYAPEPPYSFDSYLPPNLREPLAAAVARMQGVPA